MQHGMQQIKVVHYSGHKGIKPWDFIIDDWVSKDNPKNKTTVQVPGGADIVNVGKHDLNSFMHDHVLPNFDNCMLWCMKDAKTWAGWEEQFQAGCSMGNHPIATYTAEPHQNAQEGQVRIAWRYYFVLEDYNEVDKRGKPIVYLIDKYGKDE